ncbi:MAG: hypothetical protein QF578_17960 [Alphaproteobacteria bacterium]|jgi:dihydroorotate dehydrogenase|nr:hypothetical protein [Alphaproteobacteria bacterium]MDP6566719.1 hypothetical protein [Alphaproteobacteria bacterium]MDP6814224.1 hypothetical protein [Alphaproteobacteria bacterium]
MRTYRIDRSYEWNYRHGPAFAGPYPRPPRTPAKEFLGLPVNARLGISAGLLLNANWIDTYARLGFDILTYKTVRSAYRACHPMPNWLYLQDRDVDGQRAHRKQDRGPRTGSAANTVSFGMPSQPPEVWMADVGRARKALRKNQVLVVSVVGSPGAKAKAGELAEEFGALTAMAKESGAQVVEANFSCPNVATAEGDIYLDAALSGRVAKAMRAAAGTTPLLLKVGHLHEQRRLSRFLRAVAPHVDGVVLVNGITRRVLGTGRRPGFDKARPVAGILGKAIHHEAVACVERAVNTVQRDGLDLRVIGVGGVGSAAEAGHFFDVGAYAVMMGSAPMWDPLLAQRLKRAHPEW